MTRSFLWKDTHERRPPHSRWAIDGRVTRHRYPDNLFQPTHVSPAPDHDQRKFWANKKLPSTTNHGPTRRIDAAHQKMSKILPTLPHLPLTFRLWRYDPRITFLWQTIKYSLTERSIRHVPFQKQTLDLRLFTLDFAQRSYKMSLRVARGRGPRIDRH